MSFRKLCLTLALAGLVVACSQTARQPETPEAVIVGPGAVSDSADNPPAPTPVPTGLPPEAQLRERAEAARAERAYHESRRQMEEASAKRKSVEARALAASGASYAVGGYMPPPLPVAVDREQYAHVEEGSVLRAAETPVSTFSIDVDTGAYANVRRMLRDGQLPREDAVRVEELVNYFDYRYTGPRERNRPFSVHTEVAPTPWNVKTRLLRIGLQGWKPSGPLPPANLVFLVDVSGSMNDPQKLPLVKSSLQMLARQMGPKDRISLVIYAGSTGVVLEPTPGDQTATIEAALQRLQAGGSTDGGSGIQLAYAMARKGYIKDGINRVMLATDGDFNVGVTNFEQLKDLVERERASGVALSTLGFGRGNYNDQLMEQLADAGNGNYSYIDSLEEARRALVASRAATLLTIASDVKVQVEFNPAVVSEYRLIGYENRALKREDFANDKVDAGEIGAGHSVTALYEVALVGEGGDRIEPLRYGSPTKTGYGRELGHLRLRYKRPGVKESQMIQQAVTLDQMRTSLEQASESFRFAAAVAAFGQKLRGGRYTGDYGYPELLALARSARGEDADGWRAEFLQLVGLAADLTPAAAEKKNPEIAE